MRGYASVKIMSVIRRSTLVIRWGLAGASFVLLAGAAAARAQNLVVNSEFDEDVVPWTGTELSWDTTDHSACGSASGSAQGSNQLEDGGAYSYSSACITGIVGGALYSSGAWFRFPAGQAAVGIMTMYVWYFSGPDCLGTMTNLTSIPGLDSSDTGVWVRSADESQITALGARSARIFISLTKLAGGLEPLVGRFDGVWLHPRSGYLFADGFENGTSCHWPFETP